VAAVVLHSLFEEQIEHPTPDADVPHFFDNPAGPGAPRRYLDLIEECVRSVDVPVIASINGTSRQGWTSFAHSMQDAGDAEAMHLDRLHGRDGTADATADMDDGLLPVQDHWFDPEWRTQTSRPPVPWRLPSIYPVIGYLSETPLPTGGGMSHPRPSPPRKTSASGWRSTRWHTPAHPCWRAAHPHVDPSPARAVTILSDERTHLPTAAPDP
jgi:hypothetical protein